MIAVSSFKPLDKCSREIWINQLLAKNSWNLAFKAILYLGEHDENLWNSKTFFLPSEEPPTIKELASVCSKQDNWTCIINADIVVSLKILRVEHDLITKKAKCAISRRWQTNGDGDGALVDYGLDFFAAKPDVWEHVYRHIPVEFKLGHILFDTWLLSFFLRHWVSDCYDITFSKVIYHPKHEDRGDQSMSRTIGRDYIDTVRWPKKHIKL